MACHSNRSPSSVFGGKNSNENDCSPPASSSWIVDTRVAGARSARRTVGWTGTPSGYGTRLTDTRGVTSPDLRDRIDKALQAFLDQATPPLGAIAPDLQELADAGEAFVVDGGKRLRPTFCYWGYRATGAADDDRIIGAAAALELLQACALMHDDVIDDSDTRRGAPSVHRRFDALHRTAG